MSFAFNTDKDIPDLAVEVIFSSGSLDDLDKYQALGVREVWFWKNNKITFYQLETQGYIEITTRKVLPNLTSKILKNIVDRGLTESALIIEAEFLKNI